MVVANAAVMLRPSSAPSVTKSSLTNQFPITQQSPVGRSANLGEAQKLLIQLLNLTDLQNAKNILDAPITLVGGSLQMELDSPHGKITLTEIEEGRTCYLTANLNNLAFELDRNNYTSLGALRVQAATQIIKTGNVEPLFTMGNVDLIVTSIVNTPIQTKGSAQQIDISSPFGKITIIDRPCDFCLMGKLGKVEFKFAYVIDGTTDLSRLSLRELQIYFGNAMLNQGAIKTLFATDGFKSAAQDIIAATTKKAGRCSYIEVVNSIHGTIKIEEVLDNSNSSSSLSKRAPLKIIINNHGVVNTEFTRIETLQTYLKRQHEFENKLMKVLTAYSQVGALIVRKSSTMDVVNNVPYEVLMVHGGLIDQHIRPYKNDDPDLLKTIIKSSTGDCFEMALLGKVMLDLYLSESLKAIGYDVLIRSTIIEALQPADHGAVKLICTFDGNTKNYIVDSWSNGQAWSHEDGMAFFRERTPDQYTNPDLFFVEYDDTSLRTAEYVAKASAIFNHFRIKQQLDAAITASGVNNKNAARLFAFEKAMF